MPSIWDDGDHGPLNIKFDLEGSGSVGAVGRLGLDFSFGIEAQGGAQGNFNIPLFTLEGEGTVGSVGVLDITLQMRDLFTLSAVGGTSNYGRAELLVPEFRSIFGVYRGEIPLFTLRALGSEQIAAAYQAWAVNVKNAAMTEYTGFDFNHIVHFKGQTVAFSDASAVILGADDDNGVAIAGVAELATNDFGTSLMKRCPYAYIRAATNDNIKVTLIADEKETITTLTHTKGRNRRAKGGRGMKGVHWAMRIENQNGADFATEGVEYVPMILQRKV